MKKNVIPFFLSVMLLGGCIGDDIIFDTVPETLRIINPIDTLGVGGTYTFELLFTNNVGQEETREAAWHSSNTDILQVDDAGVVTGMSKGEAVVTASVDLDNSSPVSVSRSIVVDEETVPGGGSGTSRDGTIVTTSNYVLKGSFSIKKEDTDLIIEIFDDYEATSALPGLYVYLANNPNTIQGALEIGEVKVFMGAHTYTVGGDIALNQYNYLLYFCKPFNVKVGEGKIGE